MAIGTTEVGTRKTAGVAAAANGILAAAEAPAGAVLGIANGADGVGAEEVGVLDLLLRRVLNKAAIEGVGVELGEIEAHGLDVPFTEGGSSGQGGEKSDGEESEAHDGVWKMVVLRSWRFTDELGSWSGCLLGCG